MISAYTDHSHPTSKLFLPGSLLYDPAPLNDSRSLDDLFDEIEKIYLRSTKSIKWEEA